jgi:hypothetical protein
MAELAPREPVVARGVRWGFRLPAIAVTAGVFLVVVGSFVALSWLRFPWMPQELSTLPWSDPVGSFAALGFLLGTSHSLARSVFLRRAGRVELSEAGVAIRGRGIRTKKMAWTELESYSDAHPSRIDLIRIRRGDRVSWPQDAIPTRDEATRTAVLGFLDGEGLRRVDRAHSMPRVVLRMLVVGCVAAAVVADVIYFGFYAKRARFDRLALGELSREEAAALISESVTVRPLIRPRIGADDKLGVGVVAAFPPVLSFQPQRWVTFGFAMRVEVDGQPLVARGLGNKMGVLIDARTLAAWSFFWAVRGGYPTYTFLPNLARLEPGRHSIHVVSGLSDGDLECDKETFATIEVVPGSLVETIRLVPGPIPETTITGPIRYDVLFPEIRFLRDLDRAIAARLDFLEGEKPIQSGHFFARAGSSGGLFEWGGLGPTLPRGHHVLKVRFTPDRAFAFEQDGETTEILGETFERELVVDVP